MDRTPKGARSTTAEQIRREGDDWTGGGGSARVRTWPDGRRLVLLGGEPDAAAALLTAVAAGTTGRLHLMADVRDAALLAAARTAGFGEVRREDRYRIPLPAVPPRDHGVELVSARDADLERLRVLDERLRDDIPGSAGWRWTPAQFRAASVDDPEFDPRTYLVAVAPDGSYVGLARVWMTRGGPRLGCLAVLPRYRRTRVTAALLHTVVAELRGRGLHEVTAEVADTNRPARALLARTGAVRTGTDVELLRP
ncbi:MAG TPA: GNAT family N-acetyltransferase [Pseudonocardiaceae bacterium]